MLKVVISAIVLVFTFAEDAHASDGRRSPRKKKGAGGAGASKALNFHAAAMQGKAESAVLEKKARERRAQNRRGAIASWRLAGLPPHVIEVRAREWDQRNPVRKFIKLLEEERTQARLEPFRRRAAGSPINVRELGSRAAQLRDDARAQKVQNLRRDGSSKAAKRHIMQQWDRANTVKKFHAAARRFIIEERVQELARTSAHRASAAPAPDVDEGAGGAAKTKTTAHLAEDEETSEAKSADEAGDEVGDSAEGGAVAFTAGSAGAMTFFAADSDDEVGGSGAGGDVGIASAVASAVLSDDEAGGSGAGGFSLDLSWLDDEENTPPRSRGGGIWGPCEGGISLQGGLGLGEELTSASSDGGGMAAGDGRGASASSRELGPIGTRQPVHAEGELYSGPRFGALWGVSGITAEFGTSPSGASTMVTAVVSGDEAGAPAARRDVEPRNPPDVGSGDPPLSVASAPRATALVADGTPVVVGSAATGVAEGETRGTALAPPEFSPLRPMARDTAPPYSGEVPADIMLRSTDGRWSPFTGDVWVRGVGVVSRSRSHPPAHVVARARAYPAYPGHAPPPRAAPGMWPGTQPQFHHHPGWVRAYGRPPPRPMMRWGAPPPAHALPLPDRVYVGGAPPHGPRGVVAGAEGSDQLLRALGEIATGRPPAPMAEASPDDRGSA